MNGEESEASAEGANVGVIENTDSLAPGQQDRALPLLVKPELSRRADA
jgi:hypothetical protein